MADDLLSGSDDEPITSKPSGIPSEEDDVSQLTDTALRIKEAIEDRNMSALKAIFGSNARVNIDGRFMSVADLTTGAEELLKPMEQPTFDILAIERSAIAGDSALVTYLTELSWVDQKVWEEHSIKGALTLHHTRTKRGWITDGFTYARRPEVPGSPGDAGVGPTPAVPGESFGGLGRLFGFGKAGSGDIWSMWY